MNKTIITSRKGYGKSLLMKTFEDKLINDEITLNNIMFKTWESENIEEPKYIN